MTPERINRDDQETLAADLAAAVATELREAIETRGRATLAVPGGNSPGRFLQILGQITLPWSEVVVTTTDERCVPLDHPRSNARLVRETLLAGRAEAASFLPMYGGEDAALADALPLDSCLLGMGVDMHTASLFPGAPNLRTALDPACPSATLSMNPPNMEEPRISFTLPVFQQAHQLHLLIHGAEKRAALKRAEAATDIEKAPVKALLDGPVPLKIWYAP